jgi:hypothetical protein
MQTTYDYYEDADILEVFFTEDGATAAVSLTPDITLHFRPEDGTPVSLIFNNFTRLVQPDEYGPRTFPLQTARWPELWRTIVLRILSTSPVAEWLSVATYRPPRAQYTIPLATVKQPQILAQAA